MASRIVHTIHWGRLALALGIVVVYVTASTLAMIHTPLGGAAWVVVPIGVIAAPIALLGVCAVFWGWLKMLWEWVTGD